jgi:hypothetical protein
LQSEAPNFGSGVGDSIIGLSSIIGAGGGNDTIFGGKGSDQIIGDQYKAATAGQGDGDDAIDARDGISGNDILWGSGGVDTLDSDAGDTENDG